MNARESHITRWQRMLRVGCRDIIQCNEWKIAHNPITSAYSNLCDMSAVLPYSPLEILDELRKILEIELAKNKIEEKSEIQRLERSVFLNGCLIVTDVEAEYYKDSK